MKKGLEMNNHSHTHIRLELGREREGADEESAAGNFQRLAQARLEGLGVVRRERGDVGRARVDGREALDTKSARLLMSTVRRPLNTSGRVFVLREREHPLSLLDTGRCAGLCGGGGVSEYDVVPGAQPLQPGEHILIGRDWGRKDCEKEEEEREREKGGEGDAAGVHCFCETSSGSNVFAFVLEKVIKRKAVVGATNPNKLCEIIYGYLQQSCRKRGHLSFGWGGWALFKGESPPAR